MHISVLTDKNLVELRFRIINVLIERCILKSPPCILFPRNSETTDVHNMLLFLVRLFHHLVKILAKVDQVIASDAV